VPHVERAPGNRDAGLDSGRVEETQLDAGCVLAEESEVDAAPVPGRAKRVEVAGLDAAYIAS
jgi:hypothetical protein